MQFYAKLAKQIKKYNNPPTPKEIYTVCTFGWFLVKTAYQRNLIYLSALPIKPWSFTNAEQFI